MNKAAFLDRDGVINVDVLDYTSQIKDFTLLPGVFEGLKQLQNSGYLLIIITNQGGIAKGLYTKEDVDTLHNWMCAELAKQGIILTAIYFCPHHDVSGKCLCRKPGSIMLEKAMARFDIDATQSFFMGDKDTDVQAAERAGVRPVKVVVNSVFKVPV
jgi:D-glycero-D-manno-heptose 1,7-bisphosphate phosphatase